MKYGQKLATSGHKLWKIPTIDINGAQVRIDVTSSLKWWKTPKSGEKLQKVW